MNSSVRIWSQALKGWRCFHSFRIPRSSVLATPTPRPFSTSRAITAPGEYGNGTEVQFGSGTETVQDDWSAGMDRDTDAYAEWNENETEVPVSDQQSLRVAIVGAPNAGKSTIVNQLIQKKVLAVSPKVHTTCRKALGIFVEGNSQIVLMDTPGVIPTSYARKLGLSREFTADPVRSVMEADLVMVLVDAANRFTRERLDLNVLKILRSYPHLPSILVLNKVDAIKKKFLLLKLAEGLTASAQPDINRIGYLVRKSKNHRTPPEERAKVKQELAQLRAEVTSKREARLKFLDQLKTRARAELRTDSSSEVTSSESAPGSGHAQSTPSSEHAQSTPGSEHAQCDAEPVSLSAGEAGGLEKESPMSVRDLSDGHWPFFDEVFMLSALSGDGVTKLRDYLVTSTKQREWEFASTEVTDQPALHIVEDVIREKICLHTSQELPYVVKQENAFWERDGDVLSIYQYLRCGKTSRAGMLVGNKGAMIQTIREEATRDLEELFQCTVDLTLHVKA